MKKLTSIEKADTLILFDFSNLAYAAYHASFRDFKEESTDQGPAIFSAFRKVLSQLKQLADDKTALIFVLDEFPQHKRDLVASYKMNRKRLEETQDPRPLLKKFLTKTRTYFAVCANNEADDTIASICHQYKNKQIIIVSSDQDLLQLKTYSHVEIFNLIKNELYNKDFFKQKYKLNKWKFLPIYKACFGDSSDNLKPSLPRVRKDSIIPVINKTDGTLKSFIHEFWRSSQTQKTKETFNDNSKNLKLNFKIVKLNKKLDIHFIKNTPDLSIVDDFKKINIKSLDKDIKLLL